MVARPRSPCDALLPQFYAGRSIFITGATGFMGKVLIERLLSTCPDIGRLHLLLRNKKGEAPEKRLAALKQSQVFDVVRETNPSQLDKLCVIPGDVSQPGLGISASSLKELQEVSIVFHSAATLKFDEALCKAVDQNVVSVMRLLNICDTLPNLQALVHVSTAYSNAEKDMVEEKIYPTPVPLPRLLALVDAVPQPLLGDITSQYIHPKPNTYTFTKAMGEEAINSHPNRTYPVSIFRPSIVISSLRNPYPGWIENLNGPSGVVAAAGRGVLHVFRRKAEARADLLPVDMAIDTLLAVAWETAVDKLPEVRVYNCSTYENPTTWLDFEHALKKYIPLHPFNTSLWYPCGFGVERRLSYMILEICLQTIPLYIIDYIIRILGYKMKLSLIATDRKIRAMSSVLVFFALREWHFKTDNVAKLRARLTPSDRAIYNLDPKTINWPEHYVDFIKGVRKYLLKEKDQDIEEARKHLKRLYILHVGTILFFAVLVLRLILQNQSVREVVYGTVTLLTSLLFGACSRVFEVI